jgi:hypothetical protein
MSELANLAENSAENNDEFKRLEERNGRINPFNLDDELFKSVMENGDDKTETLEGYENQFARNAVNKPAELEETSAESSEDMNNAFPAHFQVPRGMVILPARIIEETEDSEENQENEQTMDIRSPILWEQVKGVVLSYQPENNDNDDSDENTQFVNEVKPIGAERIEPENTEYNLENSNEQETNPNEDNLSYKIILPNDAQNNEEEQLVDRPMKDQGEDDNGDDDDDNNNSYANNNEQPNFRTANDDDDQQQQSIDETVFSTY